MLSHNAHLIKRDGSTKEVISERNTYLHVSQLIESILTFWACSWMFVGKSGEVVFQVWEHIDDRSAGTDPAYEFIIESL